MAPNVLYTSCVIGAAALYLLLRPGRGGLKTFGALLGLGALAWVARESAAALGFPGRGPEPLFAMFSLIAIAAAIRMISHPRPVYAALYFVAVVLSSAGLFLLLEAEFMAFALVIVYAGAILITYLFVLMLAQQIAQPGDESHQAAYDVTPREPAAAVTVGFVVLALLAQSIFQGVKELPSPRAPNQVRAEAWHALDGLPRKLERAMRREVPDFKGFAQSPPHVRVMEGQAYVDVLAGNAAPRAFKLPPEAAPTNLELVGLALVAKFPASLELAGVILLVAMYGAVVLARRQIELTEDEKRQPAGGRP
jgi:NADH-quinone oxidoreductase subunit J